MNSFFENLEDSSAFSFYFDSTGKPVQVKNTDYILFQSEMFPMLLFEDELRALNDYCYKIVTAVTEELNEIQERFDYYSKDNLSFSGHMEFTPYEMQMSLQDQQSQWEWITDVTTGHLAILLYSFLEKTLKYIYKWFIEEKIITTQYKKKRPKVYFWLYNILEIDEEIFQERYREVHNALEEFRKIRNNFAHDNLEGVERESEDYIYEKRMLKSSVRLIDFITSISIILYEIEKIYKKKMDFNLVVRV